MTFITDYGGTIFVGLILLSIIALILRKFARDKRAGKSVVCGCGCSNCPHGAACCADKKN
ncbi:MAG: FeoB-associated Cys-rich membrane protein [Oscillospiraceae bacterium]|jgi:hypothetical protein|nr:FeoB-associated Cys-rich membrane protein [Oscillospiraceae bacterium]